VPVDAMTKATPRMTDTPPASSIGNWRPNCARRRRAVISCAAPLAKAQTPKTARTSATVPDAAAGQPHAGVMAASRPARESGWSTATRPWTTVRVRSSRGVVSPSTHFFEPEELERARN
jgi:hypothetical protein